MDSSFGLAAHLTHLEHSSMSSLGNDFEQPAQRTIVPRREATDEP